jgi:hypothetical protein
MDHGVISAYQSSFYVSSCAVIADLRLFLQEHHIRHDSLLGESGRLGFAEQ